MKIDMVSLLKRSFQGKTACDHGLVGISYEIKSTCLKCNSYTNLEQTPESRENDLLNSNIWKINIA